MSGPCDAFYVGQVVLSGVPQLTIVRIENGKVFVGGLSIGGVPVELGIECEGFFNGLYTILDTLGIPHP